MAFVFYGLPGHGVHHTPARVSTTLSTHRDFSVVKTVKTLSRPGSIRVMALKARAACFLWVTIVIGLVLCSLPAVVSGSSVLVVDDHSFASVRGETLPHHRSSSRLLLADGGSSGGPPGSTGGHEAPTVEDIQACPLIFASFLATRPDGWKRKRGERCNGCHKSPAWITFASAKVVHPEACTAIITDTGTAFDAGDKIDAKTFVLRYDIIDGSKIGTPDLMHERMKGYRAFLQQAFKEKWNANLVMLDSDTVVIDKITELFARRGYDYGLTARKNPGMPVQGGVQFVRSDGYQRAAEFLGHVLAGWETRNAAAKKAGGRVSDRGFGFTNDQRAYGESIGNVRAINVSLNKKGGALFTAKDGGYKVFVLPADMWNRTPSGAGSTLKRERTRILHYKGGRKDSMHTAYNALKKGGTAAVHALKSVK